MKHIPRLFINDYLEFNKIFVLDIFDTNHILHVLKKKDDDEVIVFNDSEEWEGKLLLSKKSCSVKLEKLLRKKNKKIFNVIVYLSLFKRFDFAIEKLVEVGVDTVIPVVTDFSSSAYFNELKLNKIIKGALEQSNRFGDFEITKPVNLFDIKLRDDTEYFACIERSECNNLLKVVSNISKHFAILIGPEGGFSEKEVSFINSSGFVPVSLGDNVLRSETAAIVGSFILKNSI